ncbi:MAG: nitrile hydratase subunit beta [Gammaproteobacteria bacterium]|nr:nitrile hydratase subunit beta [Gammaproteobacteria bacterium]MBI5615645.1 nitrile hydratase subunit beta [Gammaproteobacteria bacterium]
MSVTSKEAVWPIVTSSGHLRVELDRPARYKVGDRVLTKNVNYPAHTRLPRFARGKIGTVHLVHGGFPFPETMAQSGDPKPEYVYSVRFEARELWGAEGSPKDAVYVDMWDSYIEPAPETGR